MQPGNSHRNLEWFFTARATSTEQKTLRLRSLFAYNTNRETRALGVIQKYLPDLACPVVRLPRYGKGYIAVLCAPCRALKTNNSAAQYLQSISG